MNTTQTHLKSPVHTVIYFAFQFVALCNATIESGKLFREQLIEGYNETKDARWNEVDDVFRIAGRMANYIKRAIEAYNNTSKPYGKPVLENTVESFLSTVAAPYVYTMIAIQPKTDKDEALNELMGVDIEALSFHELRTYCKRLYLPATGKAVELKARVKALIDAGGSYMTAF